MNPTNALIAERTKTHGPFKIQARVTQTLHSVMRTEDGWDRLSLSQCESLHMIAHKIGRILAGDPNIKDHWDDIAGYAALISKELDVQHD